MVQSTSGRMMTQSLKETMIRVFHTDIFAILMILETWSSLGVSLMALWLESAGEVFLVEAFLSHSPGTSLAATSSISTLTAGAKYMCQNLGLEANQFRTSKGT